MERERLGLLEVRIEEEDDVMLLVIDQSEGRDATWLKTKIFHHSLGRGEAELAGRVEAGGHEALLEAMFHVVDVHVMVAMEADEVVLIAFVIAKE